MEESLTGLIEYGVLGLWTISLLWSQKVQEKRHERQIGYLSAVVGDAENSSTLMLQAIKSMGQVKDLSAIAALKTIIETHSNQSVRKQATRVLSHILARRYE